jgi:hypothetical protein
MDFGNLYSMLSNSARQIERQIMIDRIVYVWRWLTQVQVVYQRNENVPITLWWARDEADAKEWMRCIKHHTVVYGRRGKFLGGRTL